MDIQSDIANSMVCSMQVLMGGGIGAKGVTRVI